MPNLNKRINESKINKNDEFYTSLSDIENEVRFTSYQLVPDDLTGYTKKQLPKPWTKKNRDGAIETLDYMYVDADGYAQGDFRAKQQEPLWEWADVIITNPPFSLFREFVAKIMQYNKKFLVIGGQNAISYKDVFKHIKNNEMWLGQTTHLSKLEKLNDQQEVELVDSKNSNLPNTCVWYTNLNNEKQTRSMILNDWEDGRYPKYDNYDAYETVWLYGKKKRGRAEIPFTDKVLGVPITFLQKYNPNQFEILGLCPSHFEPTLERTTRQLTGDTANSITTNCKGNVFIEIAKEQANFQDVDNGKYYATPFARIFIKLKKEWYEANKEYYLWED